MDNGIFLLLITSITFFAFGIVVFYHNKESSLNRIFLLLCLAASWWAFSEFMLHQSESFNSAFFWLKLTAFWTFVPATLFHFMVIFTKSRHRLGRGWIFLIYAPAAFFCGLELFTSLIIAQPIMEYWGYTYGYSENFWPYLVEQLWTYGLFFGSMALCLLNYFRTTSKRQRQQAKYILIGVIFLVSAGFIPQVVLPAFQIEIPEMTSIFFLGFGGIIGYTIWRYKLLIISPETAADNIISTMPNSLILLDAEENIVVMNMATKNMLGYNDEYLGRPIRLLFSDETEKSKILGQIAQKGLISDYETVYRAKDGKAIPVIFSGSQIKDIDGNTVGIVCVALDITERKRIEETLNRATKKLNLLNIITFSDIQNAIFSLRGYLELEKEIATDEKMQQFLNEQKKIVQNIEESLKFASQYQNLGLKPPAWQSIRQTFLYGISHLDPSKLSRKLDVDGLEIYADPLLENVFFTLAQNVILHGKTATEIVVGYHENADGLTLFFQDNGMGVPDDMKEKIFERRNMKKQGMGLYLAREILSITGIAMTEIGTYGKGARFEIMVPTGAFRFSKNNNL